MKTFKIFLASSEELSQERMMFGDFINGLRPAFKSQGIDLELVKWEDLDSGFNGRSKEDEYIEQIGKCQLFVALFHTKAGMYTLQELEAARELLEDYRTPSIFIFIKDLAKGESQTQELEQLKEKILKQWKHFNDSYNHPDTLKLRFLQQLIIKLNDPAIRLEVEDSIVSLNSVVVASLDNLPFAANNDRYQEIKRNIEDANHKIETYQQVLAVTPNDAIEDLLNKEKKRRGDLKHQLQLYERDLFATSERIAALKSETLNQRLSQAIELFERGDNKGADALLDMRDIKDDISWLIANAGALMANSQSVISQLVFKAQNLLTIYDNPNRLDEADRLYAMALDVAQKTYAPTEDLLDLLEAYQNFLTQYSRYDKALEIGQQLLKTVIYLYGDNHPQTAYAYRNIGYVYERLAEYDKALDFYNRSLKIREGVLDFDDELAQIYNHIGNVYNDLENYDTAMDYYMSALSIQEKVYGAEHPQCATTYNNIGTIYDILDDFDKAVEYYNMAYEIDEKLFGQDHPRLISTLNNLGNVFLKNNQFEKALEYFEKALSIAQTVFGQEHNQTAIVLNGLGRAYYCLQDFTKALDYNNSALEIRRNILGEDHPDMALTYRDIAFVYDTLCDYQKALPYYVAASAINEKVFGHEHNKTATSYNYLGAIYNKLGDFIEALKYFEKALLIREKLFGKGNMETAKVYHNIGYTYSCLGRYDLALENFYTALGICENVLGFNHTQTFSLLWKIAQTYEKQGNMKTAQKIIRSLAVWGDKEALEWLETHKD